MELGAGRAFELLSTPIYRKTAPQSKFTSMDASSVGERTWLAARWHENSNDCAFLDSVKTIIVVDLF